MSDTLGHTRTRGNSFRQASTPVSGICEKYGGFRGGSASAKVKKIVKEAMEGGCKSEGAEARLRKRRRGHDCKEEGRDCDARWRTEGCGCEGGRAAGAAANDCNEVTERESRD